MKEIQITKYEAQDGKVFTDMEQCLSWEKCLLIDKEELKQYVNNFLSNKDNYEDWIKDRLTDKIQCSDLHLGSNGGGIFDLTLGYKSKDNFTELDEDFCIDWDKWHRFEEEIKEKFGCKIYTNTYYWPK